MNYESSLLGRVVSALLSLSFLHPVKIFPWVAARQPGVIGISNQLAEKASAMAQRIPICPRCNKREVEVSTLDGIMERYCCVCNDSLADKYREQQEFAHFHRED